MGKSRRSVVRRSKDPANAGRPLVAPLSPSVVYHYQDVDQLQAVYTGQIEGFTYARYGNPNAVVLAEKLSWMEGAQAGVMTASGMSTISSVFMTVLKAGDKIAAATQLYGQSLKMAERGLHTFDLRLKQAQENADKLARFLSEHPKISTVHYPGLPSHPDHARAKELLTGCFGTMVSFVLKGSRKNANIFLRAAENIPYGPTLGDVATMVIIPSISSHRELSREERLKLGIEDNLISVSVGIESFDLIKEDFQDALEAV